VVHTGGGGLAREQLGNEGRVRSLDKVTQLLAQGVTVLLEKARNLPSGKETINWRANLAWNTAKGGTNSQGGKPKQDRGGAGGRTDLVPHHAGVVADAKRGGAGLGGEEVLVVLVLPDALLAKGRVCALGEVALVVQNVEQANWPLDNQIQTALIVLKLYLRPVDSLTIVVLWIRTVH
jgi:hypothetical protein